MNFSIFLFFAGLSKSDRADWDPFESHIEKGLPAAHRIDSTPVMSYFRLANNTKEIFSWDLQPTLSM
jgi:hypothetical protein